MPSQRPDRNWPLADGKKLIPLRVWNDLMRRMNELNRGGADDPGAHGVQAVRMVEMDEELGGADSNSQKDREASRVTYDGYEDDWIKLDPAQTITNIANPYGEGFHVIKGEILPLVYHAQSGQYIPLAQYRLRRFVLTAALTQGSSASAKVLYCIDDELTTSGTGYPEISFTVHDTSRQFEQYAVPDGVTGAYGYARYYPDSQQWEIISKQPCARSCEALLVGDMATTDGTHAVDNVVPIDGGFSPVTNSAATLTVTNRYAMEGDDDGPCEIYWDGTDWAFRQCKCPA